MSSHRAPKHAPTIHRKRRTPLGSGTRRGRHERDSYGDAGITAAVALIAIFLLAAVVDGTDRDFAVPATLGPAPTTVRTPTTWLGGDDIVLPPPSVPDDWEPSPITSTTVIPEPLEWDRESLEDLVASYFGDHFPWAERVIHCESRWSPDAKNPTSTAAGLWQFTRSTWDWVADSTGSPSYSAGGPYDPYWATVNAWHLYDHGSGASHWSCST